MVERGNVGPDECINGEKKGGINEDSGQEKKY